MRGWFLPTIQNKTIPWEKITLMKKMKIHQSFPRQNGNRFDLPPSQRSSLAMISYKQSLTGFYKQKHMVARSTLQVSSFCCQNCSFFRESFRAKNVIAPCGGSDFGSHVGRTTRGYFGKRPQDSKCVKEGLFAVRRSFSCCFRRRRYRAR